MAVYIKNKKHGRYEGIKLYIDRAFCISFIFFADVKMPHIVISDRRKVGVGVHVRDFKTALIKHFNERFIGVIALLLNFKMASVITVGELFKNVQIEGRDVRIF